MKIHFKGDFIMKSIETLDGIFDLLAKSKPLKLSEISGQTAAFIMIDMVNGFAREGALKSNQVEALIPEIAKFSKRCEELGIVKVAFADNHAPDSPEFDAYPVHCVAGTDESEIVDEIKEIGGYTLIPKSSTNGFLEEKFQQWLQENGQIDTFIISGDCTDICIQQFAITLKTWYNMQNRKARVIVPISLVDTYDLGIHDGDLTNVMAFYNMLINGVEIVKSIEN